MRIEVLMLRIICFCLAVFAITATTLGQVTSTAQTLQEDRIVVGTNLVTVNVIVSDGSGLYVNGLTQDQFTVYDNKVKQQIAHFSKGLSSERY